MSKVTVKVKNWKGPVTRNAHVKYGSPICYGSMVMIKVSECRSKVTIKLKRFGTNGKVLSQGIHNVKYEIRICYESKVIIKFKFYRM